MALEDLCYAVRGLKSRPGFTIAVVLTLALGIGANAAMLGGVAAFIVGCWVQFLLFEESARDPVVFGAVAAVLLVVAALACFIPARRAGRVDPMQWLRAE